MLQCNTCNSFLFQFTITKMRIGGYNLHFEALGRVVDGVVESHARGVVTDTFAGICWRYSQDFLRFNSVERVCSPSLDALVFDWGEVRVK